MNFRPGSRAIAAASARVGLDRRMVDVVDIFEEIVRRDAVLLHQAAQRRAVAPVVVLLDALRFLRRRA